MQRLSLAIVIVLSLLIAPACHRGAAPPPETGDPLPKGGVLLLPPRNVVQDGRPHPVGADSGDYFLARLRESFEVRGWRVITTDSPDFTNSRAPTETEAVAEGRRLGADYVLRTVLGEFRDAFPMTFRADYVTLDSAHLFHADSGAVLWSTNLPTYVQGVNLKSYHRLLYDVSEILVRRVVAARVDEETLRAAASPPPAVRAPDPAASSSTDDSSAAGVTSAPSSCTTDQVLSMKGSGLTDDQVRAACGE